MRLQLVLSLASIAAVVSCTAEPSSPRPEHPGVTLRTATPERVTGSYLDPGGIRLEFDAARAGDGFYLDVRSDDHVLIHAETVGESYVFSYLDGKLTMSVERAWIEAVRAEEPDGPASQREDALQWSGDTAVLDEMLALPEVAVLPWLSRALGELGITGGDYPASLALHKIARQSADALAIDVPPLATANADRCSRPTANECYGMCGPGCSCWSWVCGDCCYHGGCAKHDSWCRNGQWYWCYNITAVVAMFGC